MVEMVAGSLKSIGRRYTIDWFMIFILLRNHHFFIWKKIHPLSPLLKISTFLLLHHVIPAIDYLLTITINFCSLLSQRPPSADIENEKYQSLTFFIDHIHIPSILSHSNFIKPHWVYLFSIILVLLLPLFKRMLSSNSSSNFNSHLSSPLPFHHVLEWWCQSKVQLN